MSMPRRQPTPMVRPRPLGVPWGLCLATFALTAVVVYRLGHEKWQPTDARPLYTATAFVSQSQERTAAASSDDDPRRAVDRANALAGLIASDRRAEWAARLEGPCAAAREAVQRACLEYDEIAVKLDALRRQAAESAAKSRAAAPAEPSMADNPQWLKLRRQLTDLERRRERLLADRTPLHPAVQRNAVEITEVETQLAAVPRQVPRDTATAKRAEPAAPIDTAAIDRATAGRDQRQQLLDAATLALRQLEERQKAGPQLVVERAQAVKNPRRAESGWPRLLWSTTMAGVLMAFGVGMVSFGRGIEPVVASVSDVEAQLDEPAIGVVPADQPLDRRKVAVQRKQMRRTAITLGLVLMAACPAVAALGLTGI